jgi:8-oxo-dGTP pyrophosphatase MutT (NUDIX family)
MWHDGEAKLRYRAVVSAPFSIDELHCRLESRNPRELSARQRASVAIILGQSDDGTSVLLIRRAEHPDDPWSGHMGLPGGRRDPSDVDDLATAKRETCEEVGLDLTTHARLLGRLDDITATAKGRALDMVISPFVFSVETVTPVVPTAEVVACYWAPIQPLFSGHASTTHWVDLPGGRTGMPAWNVQGNIVWGLTFRMLSSLFSIMRV